ncbi:restriction endonuclease subunit S, partial [Pediococcus damnosus LMG 28219]|uniref:restriction endonuclease subunit S n=1 Tax=Pediococcus damnosus TaxID=51663 RepID=UPI00061E0A27
VRFAGFDDAWELRKLDEVAEFKDNLRIPVTKSDRISGNIPYYGANGIQDYVKGYTHNGEFVLIAEDGANDVMNYPVHYVSGKVWVNNHAHVITGKNEVLDNLYLSSLIKSMNISSWLVGGGRAKLNGEILKKIPINLPTLDEQREIGTFFKGIDRLIAANQRQLEQLKTIKKLAMQKIFDQEWRFKGYTDPWEQRKLNEVVN